MSNVYYGWIPILGTRLYFDYAIKNLEKEGKKLSEKDIKTYNIKYDSNHEYYSIDVHEDVENKKFKFIVFVDKNNKKVDNICVYGGKKCKEFKAWAGCNIDDKGLVTLELKYLEEKEVRMKSEEDEKEKVKEFYRIVRNIYHSHTHHEDSKDSLLKPVPAKDRLDSIEQILTHFEQKIIIAHKELRDEMQSPKRFDSAAKLITQHKGEMIYALNFVNLFKAEIHLKTQNPDKYKEYNFVFSNALQSLNDLTSKIENTYNHKLNETIIILTLEILFLTFPITVDAILKVQGIETTKLLVSGVFFFYILLSVWFILLVHRNKFS